jgi:hypothetical protein
MSNEVPTGDGAIFAFLEMVALAFAFEGTSALLRGEPWSTCIPAYCAAIILFLAGIKWPWIKTKFGDAFQYRATELSRKPTYWFMFGSIAGIALFWAVLRGADILGLSHKIETSVRIERHDFTRPTPNTNSTTLFQLEPNKTIGMNLGVKNFGPLPAHTVGVAAEIRWLPIMTKSIEDDRWEEFRRRIPLDGSSDLEVGDQAWSSHFSQPLSEQDITDIQGGRMVLYVFMHFEYSDGGGKHFTDSCEWLQTPVPQGIFPGSLHVTFHHCIGHNKIR